MSDADRIFAVGGAMEAALDAKKAGKVRYIGFTGHKSPDIHLKMLETAAKHQFRFDTVQMPLNVMDAHYDSFEKNVLPAALLEALDLDVVFERLLVDDNNQNLVFTVGKDGILWKLDRKTGKYLGHKETVFQNVWDRFDPQSGQAVVPVGHPGAQVRRVGARLPEHRGRPQLAGVEFSRGNESAAKPDHCR